MKHSVWLFSEPISATILWFNVTWDWPCTAAAHTVCVGLLAVQYGHCIQLDASDELFYGEPYRFKLCPVSEKSWCVCSCPFVGDQSGDRTATPRQPLPFKTPSRAQPSHRGQIGACQTRQQVILLELVRQLQSPSKAMCSVQKQLDYLWSLTHRWHCESFKSQEQTRALRLPVLAPFIRFMSESWFCTELMSQRSLHQLYLQHHQMFEKERMVCVNKVHKSILSWPPL